MLSLYGWSLGIFFNLYTLYASHSRLQEQSLALYYLFTLRKKKLDENWSQYFSVTVSGRSLTLSHVKPRRLCEAIYDEFEGLGCGVHCPGQFLYSAAPNLALHALSQVCTPDLVCTPTHNGQKSGQEWKKYGKYSKKCENDIIKTIKTIKTVIANRHIKPFSLYVQECTHRLMQWLARDNMFIYEFK